MNLYILTLSHPTTTSNVRVYRDRDMAQQNFDVLCDMLKTMDNGQVRLEWLDTSLGTGIGLEGDTPEIPLQKLREYWGDGDKYWEDGMETWQVGIKPYVSFVVEELVDTVGDEYVGVGEFRDGTWGHPSVDDDRPEPNYWLKGGGWVVLELEDSIEDFQVMKIDRRLQDGSCIGVTLEGQGGDIYTCDVFPSDKVMFETGVVGKMTPGD